MTLVTKIALLCTFATWGLVAHAISRSMCKAGTFFNANLCKPCPMGAYQNVTGSLSCHPCPKGTFFHFKGGQAVDVCEPCPAGTFNLKTGSTSKAACTKCPKGKNSIEGSPFCLSCPPGSVISFCTDVAYPTSLAVARRLCKAQRFFDFLDEPLNLKCRACPSGTFSGRNARKCQDCKQTQFSEEGSAKCSRCSPVGCYFECDNFSVFDFRAREYELTGDYIQEGFFTSGCTDCPPGFLGNKEKGSTKCVPCPPATFREEFHTQCAPCKPGENTNVSGAAFCMLDNTPCPRNFFREARGACSQCNRMQKYNEKKNQCDACSPGEESKGGVSTYCTKCSKGSVSTEEGCICAPGRQREVNGKCAPCPPGKISELYAFGSCFDCDGDTIARRPGSTKCTKCPAGQVPLTGHFKCKKCPKGTVRKLVKGDTPECVVPQTNCPPGYERFLDKSGTLYACSATACPAGTFKETLKNSIRPGDRRVVCQTCSTQYRYNPIMNTCVLCENNEFSKGGLDTKCRRCPGSSVWFRGKCACVEDSEIVNGTCRKCALGTRGFPDMAGCVKCQAGTFGTGTRFGERFCKKCRSGTFSREGVRECTECPKGTTTFGQGDANCVKPGSLKRS